MDFEIIVSQTFIDSPEKKYINDCCVGCDEILYKLRDEIASAMNVGAANLEIYQEDWGWALEFSKNEFSYFVGVEIYSKQIKIKQLFPSELMPDEK
jgi:hypothetical protein